VRRKVIIRRRKIGYKDWWDRGCTRRKRRVQRIYKQWKIGKLSLRKFIEEKKSFREFLWTKQKEKRERVELELESIKNEAEVWKYINRKRGKRRYIRNNIEMVKWKAHFGNLLGGEELKEEVRSKYGTRSNEECEEL